MPTGKIPYFVNSKNIILLIELYKKFQMRSVRGLVSIQLLAALNIYFAGSTKDSKDVMSEYFHKLSLQALSIEHDRIHITFEAMNKIHQIIGDNLNILKFEFMKDEIERSFEDDKKFQDTIVPMETPTNNVTETDLVQTILKDEKPTFHDNNSHPTFPQTPEETKKEEEENKNKSINHQLKINQRNFEAINNLIDEDKKELQNSFNDRKEIPIFSEIFITDDINPDDNRSTLHVETKEKLDEKINKIIKQNNQNVVTDALSNKEILDSIFSEKSIAQKMFEKEEAFKTIQIKLETILLDDVDFNDIKIKPESVLIKEDEVKKILKYQMRILILR